jgi:Xaa-Pro dipeptidase
MTMTVRRESVFDEVEFGARRQKVRAKMAENGIDTLIVHSPGNIYYLCGHYTLNLWDYQCLVLPGYGKPFMLLWHFEEGRFAATAVDTDLELFGSGDDPFLETRAVLEKRNCQKGTVGLEKNANFLTPLQFEKLCNILGPDRIKDCSGIVERVRMVKSDAELDIIRIAAKGTDRAMRAAYAEIKEGAVDHEIAAAVLAELARSGTEGISLYPMIAVGERSGVPHHSHDGVTVSKGDLIFLEFSPAIEWYHAPIMRSAALGSVPEIAARIADAGTAALHAMCDTMKAGVPASTVAAAGKAEVDKVRDMVHFHDHYAYSVGIGFPPTWLESGFGILMNNHEPLQEGMVFHFPMTLRVKGEFGVGQSQTVIVGKQKSEVLSEIPLGIHKIGE